MTTMIFLAATAAIFFTSLAIESDSSTPLRSHRPAGLFTWLTSGNWPAKIGGILVVIGVGALLRFALLHIDIPSQLKLTIGLVIAFLLGLASIFSKNSGNANRPVSLALGGSAFGVAYLTVYSAFVLFGYLDNPTGMGLLLLTAIAGAVYAVTRSALSLALISMIGAFIAPAFSVETAGPGIIYSYYIAASLLTLMMVAARGWRPLIHLSFLFTLLGSIFFSWMQQFNNPQYAQIMQSALLVLVGLHVLMPLLEKRHQYGAWMARLDLVYLLFLPAVAVFLAINISANRADLSEILLNLAVVWFVPAVVLRLIHQEGQAAHFIISILLAITAAAAHFEDLPWELLLLTASVIALSFSAWKQPTASRLHDTLAGLVLLLAAIHLLNLAAVTNNAEIFMSAVLAERLAGAFLLIVAGLVCRKIKQALDTLLLAVGVSWAVLALGAELIRLDLTTLAVAVHWTLILMAASLWVPGRRIRVVDNHVTLLAIAILGTAAWSTTGAIVASVVWFSLFGSVISLIALAIRPAISNNPFVGERLTAVIMAPAVTLLWAFKIIEISAIDSYQFAYLLVVLVAFLSLIVGRLLDDARAQWLVCATDIFAALFVILLVDTAIIDIQRNLWAVSLELLCWLNLVGIGWLRRSQQRSTYLLTVISFVALGLIFQANILRLLGPEGDLSIFDLITMDYPSVVSLLWVLLGASLTVWSKKVASKLMWSTGALLLVIAAIKLILVDFGSLGQIANILAVIAAGITFLLVGWLAPMPPSNARSDRKRSNSHSVNAQQSNNDDIATGSTASTWMLAIVIFSTVLFFQFHDLAQTVIRKEIINPISSNYKSKSQKVFSGHTQPSKKQQEQEQRAQQTTRAKKPEDALSIASKPEPKGPSSSDLNKIPKLQNKNQGNMTVTGIVGHRKSTQKESVKKPVKEYTVTIGENGERIYTQTSASINKYRSTQTQSITMPAKGRQGIQQLLRKGKIRRATAIDVHRWILSTGRSEQDEKELLSPDYSSRGQYIFRTYVVLQAMEIPRGLTGANAVRFILPPNVPRPTGNLGHSEILEIL